MKKHSTDRIEKIIKASLVLLLVCFIHQIALGMDFDDLPKAVQDAFKAECPSVIDFEVEKFNENGIKGFEIVFEIDNVVTGVILTKDGKIAGRWSVDENDEDEEEMEIDPLVLWLAQLDRQFNADSLRRAIEYLSESYPKYRPQARGFLTELTPLKDRFSQIKARIETTGELNQEGLEPLLRDIHSFKRKAFIQSNPLFEFEKLLLVKRYTYQSSHFYTDFIDGVSEFGGNICVLDMRTGEVTELVPRLADGVFGRFDLSFDAGRIVFDWKRKFGEGFRVYEVGIDGENLRQLTFPPADEQARIRKYDNSFLEDTARQYQHHTDDMQPCFLPDGGICFTSTRCEYGTLCDAADILTTAVLHRMDGDGRNMERLTNSSVSEFSPTVMTDGRVLYSRWEYVDKGQIAIKCLWAMRPDGGGSVEVFGNNIALPPTLVHSRQIPGHESLFVCLGTPHFPQSGIGTVIQINTSKNIRTREPMKYITPDVDLFQEWGWNHRINGEWIDHKRGPLYMDPFPLNDKFFLVSHNPDKPWDDPSAYGIYLLDEWGNHTLIFKDEEMSCWQPMPLRSRTRPPIVTTAKEQTLADRNLAVCVVQDIYRGLEGVERGSVKYIRIMEQVPRPWGARRFWDQECEYGHHSHLSLGTVLGLKVMHGIVPVYGDGSAHFTVPADKNIYFQALDENFMELQRERTYVNYRPGETRSCIGCHERTTQVPSLAGRYTPLALKKPPSTPVPQPGDTTAARAIHYPTDVQPVLDRHCVQCHGFFRPKAGLNLTGRRTIHFSKSYENILERDLVKTFNEGSDYDGAAYAPPKTVGSHASELIRQIRKGCRGNKKKLPLEDFVKIVTWVDANAQYYGTYYGRQHLRYKKHPHFRPVPTFEDAVSPFPPWEDNPDL